MIKFIGAAGVAASLLLSSPVSAQAVDGLHLRPVLGLGYGWGGDTITPVTVVPQGTTIEYDETIKAGTGIDLRAGIELAFPKTPFALQLALAYQNDGVAGLDNKNINFRRVPVELIGYWRVAPQVRIGFGARKAAHASLRVSQAYCADINEGLEFGFPCTIDYKSNVGVVIEGEYALTPGWALRARYVRETFEIKNADDRALLGDGKVRGDHLGILSVWYLR